MSLTSRIFSFFSSSAPSNTSSHHAQSHEPAFGFDSKHERHNSSVAESDTAAFERHKKQKMDGGQQDEAESRPPYLHSMLAGGFGGTTGDLLMHSIDTVKTRQQGDPHIPPKYTSMSSSYATILRQEGVRRGLYGGVFPAFLGSFPGTIIFFGTYEYSKRHLKDSGVNPHISYLTAGFLADLAASVVYVPSEVLKTRLQLQGRYNNPHFHSGYNYRSTIDATRTIIRNEGLSALFYGYKATLFRDLPFSALQFAFYEQAREWAKEYVGSGRNIGLRLEMLTAAGAGGLAGVLTCPLDVVKTRIQTQVNPTTPLPHHQQSRARSPSSGQTRPISTSSPSTTVLRKIPGSMILDTSSVLTGLKLIYKAEGLAGWFRGVGPRFVWTSVQSCTMLAMYQMILRQFEIHPLVSSADTTGHQSRFE
ncbi:MAG: hypothetical protein M1833_000154 [Piccolia ochrophora]|nr:MAG: hypothetical protein M1833_000154 [Piccolia ochrophora]